jgi:NAD(P)-dependent dehydrogenase (short-subunit alcohol dehydrogenase family)
MTENAWDDVLATNLRGMFFSIKACLPYLKKSKAGRIVLYAVHHWSPHRLPGVVARRGDQSRYAGIYAHRRY